MRLWVQSLRKSPTVWFWFTQLFLFFTISSLAPVVREEGQTKGWIGWVAAALILYTAALSIVYLPRVRFPEDVRPAIYWAFALSPVLVGITAPLLGSGQWVAALGHVLSAALLWRARTLIKKSAI